MTGATGTVGGHLLSSLEALEARETGAISPVAAVRSPERAGDLGVPVRRFDFEDASTYDAFEGIDAVFLVRPPAIAQVWSSIFPALDAAVDAGVEHVVFLSIQGAGENPLVPHRWIEWKLNRLPIRATFLRPSFFMQNLTTTHRAEIRDESVLYMPAGDGKTAFIDARDIAEVAAQAFIDPTLAGQALELTGDDALTYHEVAQILSEVLGRSVEYADPSPLAFVAHARSQGHPWGFVIVMLGIYLTARFGQASRTTSTVEEILGRPPISFRQFADDHAATWRPTIT